MYISFVRPFLCCNACGSSLSLSVLNKRGRSWDSPWIESHSPKFHSIFEGPSGAKDREAVLSKFWLGCNASGLCGAFRDQASSLKIGGRLEVSL